MARFIHVLLIGAILAIPSAEAQTNSANPPASDAQSQVQSIVQAYMQAHAAPQSTVTILTWSDFTTSGDASQITLHYSVASPTSNFVAPTVRFTVRAGSVAGAAMVQTTPPPLVAHPILPTPAPAAAGDTPPADDVDRFHEALIAAKHGRPMTLQLDSAFSLSQLDQAKAKAKEEKKPLGFLMVWGEFFGNRVTPENKGSDSALVHFYEVFNKELVLVYVRHETELGQVPDAVKQGFGGPDEGGFAPNMAVTDASATEFITEIPYKGLDGADREPLFEAGAKKINDWLTNHPDALPVAAPGGTKAGSGGQ